MSCGYKSASVEENNSKNYGLAFCFFFQAEDGIRDAQESRGLGDVYKRQGGLVDGTRVPVVVLGDVAVTPPAARGEVRLPRLALSLIHI